MIRTIGDIDASNGQLKGGGITYAQGDFARYTQDPTRALMLYWVVMPANNLMYLGEKMYVAWCSRALEGGNTISWAPISDLYDASNNVVSPVPLSMVKSAMRFKCPSVVVARDMVELGALISRGDLGENGSRRLYLPASFYIAQHAPSATENKIPFSYDVANQTTFGAQPTKTIIGGRFLQLVSHYMFAAAGNAQIAYFPAFAPQAANITAKIIDELGSALAGTDSVTHEARTGFLRHMMAKHGSDIFNTSVNYVNSTTSEKIGTVSSVLAKLDELFVMFVVTLRANIGTQCKGHRDSVQFVQVPVVLRIKA
jgi:hypothetical protein